MISGNVLWHPDRQTSWARSAWGQQRAGSGHRRSKCHGSPSWTVHPHLQGNIKISNICTKMLSPVVLTVALAVQKWLNSRLIAVRTGGRGARGESETSKQTKNTVDTAQLFIVTATLVSRYCNVGVKFDISMLKPQFEVDISNTYQNRGSQHHGKNTQDSLNCLR